MTISYSILGCGLLIHSSFLFFTPGVGVNKNHSDLDKARLKKDIKLKVFKNFGVNKIFGHKFGC